MHPTGCGWRKSPTYRPSLVGETEQVRHGALPCLQTHYRSSIVKPTKQLGSVLTPALRRATKGQIGWDDEERGGAYMPAIDLRELMLDVPIEAALGRGYGFVRTGDEELPRTPLPTLTYPSMRLQQWVETCNQRLLPVPAPGCLFFQRLMVYGPGHVLLGDDILVEPSEMSGVAVRWHSNQRNSIPTRQRRVVSVPVIVVITPGHLIYGHWLADILPRIAVAQSALGPAFSDWALLLPSNTPAFALEMCSVFLGAAPRVEFYDYDTEIITAEQICVPTSPVSMEHNFHSLTQCFFKPYQAPTLGNRKLCLSRARIEGRTNGAVKSFPQRDFFESCARLHGFEIVYPEEHSIIGQIELFQSARAIVGEYGSGLHNSIFAASGAIVGATGYFNTYQQRLCEMAGQRNTFVIPYEEEDQAGVKAYACAEPEISEMFKAIDAALGG